MMPVQLELGARTDRLLALHYGLTIFLGAFLLFQVQPILGKLILPWFGGSASVWTTCMLFFQVLLLAGYWYSHCIVTYLSPRRQTIVHLALLIVSLFLLPLSLDGSLRPTGAEDPTLRILLLLTVSAGLPYFCLSTTGPLVQAWFAREQTGAVPYRLFALSNLGCLIALLGYPTAVEPFMPTRSQALLWSALFAVFVASYALLAWRAKRLPVLQRRHDGARVIGRPALTTLLVWVALAACPSMLLLAITSHVTANIAPVPLLWVIPLALYLLSFIICFGGKPYNRRVYRPLLLVSLFAVALMPFVAERVPMLVNLAIHLGTLFVACMVCHGELALKQPDSRHLTNYYLMLAVGGAAGGLFIGLVAPYTFNDQYELSVSLVLTAAVVWSLANKEEKGMARGRGVVDLTFVGVLIVSLAAFRVVHHRDELRGADVVARNFYGRLKVASGEDRGQGFRYLTHGGIIHGLQFTSPNRQDQPTTYYSHESGIGRTLIASGDRSLRVGVVGLGVGTLLTYGRAGDYFRLYDIDPLVVDIARSHFTYLRQTPAQSDVVLGDARLSLEKESPQAFNVLAVDAFSGDAIPVHLLTQEAFLGYFRHLKPDGILAIHVTNRYLKIDQVVKAAAHELGYAARLVTENTDAKRQVTGSQWVLVARQQAFFDKPGIREVATDIQVGEGVQAWRDDYSSLLKLIKWKSSGF